MSVEYQCCGERGWARCPKPGAYRTVRDIDGATKLGWIYHGYCADCWVRLTPAQRAILGGEEPVQEIRTIEYRMPATTRFRRIAGHMFKWGQLALTLWLLWKMKR